MKKIEEKEKRTYTTCSVESKLIKEFRIFAVTRGFSASRALELAIRHFITTGCDQVVEKFRKGDSI